MQLGEVKMPVCFVLGTAICVRLIPLGKGGRSRNLLFRELHRLFNCWKVEECRWNRREYEKHRIEIDCSIKRNRKIPGLRCERKSDFSLRTQHDQYQNHCNPKSHWKLLYEEQDWSKRFVFQWHTKQSRDFFSNHLFLSNLNQETSVVLWFCIRKSVLF